MAKAIGLDIGSRTVTLVEIEGSPRKYRVRRYVSREMPGEGGAAEGEVVAETVNAVLREAKAQQDTMVATIDPMSVVIREISVPFLQEDQIRRVLKFEAEAHLHNYAIEDVVVDYVKVGELGQESRVLIFAAPKDRLRERLASVRKAGVDPMHLDFEVAALYNAALAAGAFESHPHAILLDVGANTTKILFVRDGTLRACRVLRTGTESITRMLSRDLATDRDTARDRARLGDAAPREDDLLQPLELEEERPETEQSAESLENAIVVQRQDDFLARVHREATRSLAVASAAGSVDAVYLTGGGSLAPGMAERIEERFGIPVLRLDFLGDGEHGIPAADRERVNAGMGVALGCALKLLGPTGIDLEFRRDDLRYTRKFDLIKVPLASTVSLIFILLFLTWLSYKNRLTSLTIEHRNALVYLNQNYIQGAKEDYKRTLGESLAARQGILREASDPFERLPLWNSQIRKMHRYITNDLGYNVQDIPAIRSALGVWRDVWEKLSAIRAQLGYMYIDSVSINQSRMSIDGLLGERTNIDTIVREIRKLDYVERVDRRTSGKDEKTGRYKLGLTVILKPTVVRKRGR